MMDIVKTTVWCLVAVAAMMIIEMNTGNIGSSYTTEKHIATGLILSR